MGTITEQAAIWQREADEVYEPIRWLPFWRPRIVVKRGRFSPCGHLSRLHFLIWAAAGAVVLKNTAIRSGFAWIGAHMGPWVAVGAFALFLISSLIGFRALLYWFEHQADDYAVARVGPEATVAALSWLKASLFGGEKSPWLDARINCLRLLHGLAQ